jgi:uncharacterized damage-inducible protein DinB
VSAAEPVTDLLARERDNLLAMFLRVPEAHRTTRPSAGAWSAMEILEHCARVEGGVAKLLALRAAEPLTATAEEAAAGALTEEKVQLVRTRAEKLAAPERVQPTGTLSVDAVMRQAAASRAALLGAYAATPGAVLDGAVHPHPFIGPLTLRAWVHLIAHHDARHAGQMGEVADHWSKVT